MNASYALVSGHDLVVRPTLSAPNGLRELTFDELGMISGGVISLSDLAWDVIYGAIAGGGTGAWIGLELAGPAGGLVGGVAGAVAGAAGAYAGHRR